MSYYKGKLYLYFWGDTRPAFWPYLALTGNYLPQKNAAVIFCFIGFVISVGLLDALWRRYFAEVSAVVVAAGALALGLATCTPLLLARCDVFEVCISCGYAFTMLALGAVWKALHCPSQRGRWLMAASLSYGLAVAAALVAARCGDPAHTRGASLAGTPAHWGDIDCGSGANHAHRDRTDAVQCVAVR